MRKQVQIKVRPEKAEDDQFIQKMLAKRLRISEKRIKKSRLTHRSIDARGLSPLFFLRYEVDIDQSEVSEEVPVLSLLKKIEKHRFKILIVGAGPAGYFAALQCIEQGLKPIVLDRGKDVQARRRDLKAIQQFGKVNPNSNYCFGEGGAGTYSDGKLYTRSHKRGSIEKVLKMLVEHGAPKDILIDAYPHIGSNRLPKIIEAIRSTIKAYGGEVHFNSRVIDFIVKKKKITGVHIDNGEILSGDAVILATGHSARNIFRLCADHHLHLEFKPFAVGVRIEHPQELIDEIQYNQKNRGTYLPAATYRLACQVDKTGVFSFCMCPGGLIVPSSTAPGELVVNGMSLSKRDSPFANAGIVTAVDENNIFQLLNSDKASLDKFAGLDFQADLEKKIFKAGDGSQKAPAQKLTDFVEGKVSSELHASSYIPGLYPANFGELLPFKIYDPIRRALELFDRKMKGFYSEEAQLIGLESRTSSPIKIGRNKINLMSDELIGLFPCGEGAGYAGGILSAAMDGQNVSKAVAKWLG